MWRGPETSDKAGPGATQPAIPWTTASSEPAITLLPATAWGYDSGVPDATWRVRSRPVHLLQHRSRPRHQRSPAAASQAACRHSHQAKRILRESRQRLEQPARISRHLWHSQPIQEQTRRSLVTHRAHDSLCRWIERLHRQLDWNGP